MTNFVLLVRITTYCAFACLTAYLLKSDRRFDLLVLFIGGISVFAGELLNLYVGKMAVYNGFDGIPPYIVFGGAMLVWGLNVSSAVVAGKLKTANQRRSKIASLLAFSLLLPLVELFGLKAGLWYWRRPYPILSLAWYLGVWKYYFTFITVPAFLAEFLRFKQTK
ncbi:MAG: hypothetical protein GXP32_09340 [Kiritimatiellaeota bacterium]|nr:hypothetical protein [Kiritimatiellota bacterium]